MGNVEGLLRNFIGENILFSDDGYPYPDDMSFLENGVVDSMSVMELVLYSEKEFEIKIHDYEILPANFDSISNLSNFIRQKIANSS